MSGYGNYPAAGTALQSATWFYPGWGRSPVLMREKSITTAFGIKMERQFKIMSNFVSSWVTPLVLWKFKPGTAHGVMKDELQQFY